MPVCRVNFMKNKKIIALIAHDSKKSDIVNWATKNKEKLSTFELCGTGHTAKLISEWTIVKEIDTKKRKRVDKKVDGMWLNA